jgi:hypothetical protein
MSSNNEGEHARKGPSVGQGRRAPPAWVLVPKALRYRKRGGQGRPEFVPELGPTLYQWFVDIRKTVRGRLSPRLVETMARQLQTKIIRAVLNAQKVPHRVVINRKWRYKWQYNYKVSLRKPSIKYKASKSKVAQYLLVYWSNLLAVRFFFKQVFHIEPVHEQYDQTGKHLNEASSKNMPTLTSNAESSFAIIDNFAQSRQRVSYMTATFSDLDGAAEFPSPSMQANACSEHEPRLVPLELCFKADSDRLLRTLVAQDPSRFTTQVAPFGSYREGHVLTFLERHLPVWSKEREEKNDYRILGLDAYRAHQGQQVIDLAWSRGYLAGEGLQIPPHCTGIVAGPDTDLHSWFEKELLELQMLSAHQQLELRPHTVPKETHQNMFDLGVSLWLHRDHTEGQASFKRNGLNNALDGTEDYLITRSAKEFWLYLKMDEQRKIIESEVDAFITGKVQPCARDVFELLRLYPESFQDDIQEEGEEIETTWAHDEKRYREDGEQNCFENELGDEGKVDDDDNDDDDDDCDKCDGSGGGNTGNVCADVKIPLLNELKTLEVLVHIAKRLDDPSVMHVLHGRQEMIQRSIRHSEDNIAGQMSMLIKDMSKSRLKAQEHAAMEDEAKKHLRQIEKAKVINKKRKAGAKCRAELKDVIGFSAPSAEMEPGNKVPLALEHSALPLTLSLAVVPKNILSAESAGSIGQTASKVTVSLKAGVAESADSGMLHPKKNTAAASKLLALKSSDMVLGIDCDTEVKIRSLLERLAIEWEHMDKRRLLLWLARDLREDIRKCKGTSAAGGLLAKPSKYLHRSLDSSDQAKGKAECRLMRRVQQMTKEERGRWFERRLKDMSKEHEVSKALDKKDKCSKK